jgi:phospholipid/cholesterol/gamma-HCH transport system substrate-binding protein
METRARYTLIGAFMLAVILASFAFVYWLENKGGFGQRSYYTLRFDGPVSGLLVGSAVLFNGIRVGEVVDLSLDSTHPERVIATVGVAHGTPMRSDTKVGVESQGLAGGVAVTLVGGDASSPPVTAENGALPVLSAEPGAGQDWQSLGREVLRKLDGILADNADNLRSAIANLKTFTDVLARNSDRIEGLLGGLERLTGGPAGKEQAPTYDLTAAKDIPARAEAPSWQLVVPEPAALLAVNSDKIKLRPAEGESIDIPNARWADNAPILLQEKLIQSFENAGYSKSVSRPRDGFEAAYQLLLDIRTFSLSTAGEPVAEIEFEAKILGPDGKIVAARTFSATVPATGTDAGPAASALNQAFGKAAKELVPWTAEVVDSLPPLPSAEPEPAPEAAPEAAPDESTPPPPPTEAEPSEQPSQRS